MIQVGVGEQEATVMNRDQHYMDRKDLTPEAVERMKAEEEEAMRQEEERLCGLTRELTRAEQIDRRQLERALAQRRHGPR